MTHTDVYEALAAEFDHTFTDTRGGVQLEYITGEQCISRLNDVLGVAGWAFTVKEHGFHQEADEMWVLGSLSAEIEGYTVVREQFGSQKLKRSRSSGQPLDIGFDLKGAATDCLKKCASLIGVGLYLSKKSGGMEHVAGAGGQDAGRSGPAPHGGAAPARSGVAGGGDSPPQQRFTPQGDEVLTCEECGVELKETRFKDGTTWGPTQLAGYGRRKHGRALCMDHYRAANEARKAATQGALSS